jgi:hypothetical protein
MQRERRLLELSQRGDYRIVGGTTTVLIVAVAGDACFAAPAVADVSEPEPSVVEPGSAFCDENVRVPRLRRGGRALAARSNALRDAAKPQLLRRQLLGALPSLHCN